jgi:hypothetical protein
MSFRQPKSSNQHNRDAWADWITGNRPQLHAIGLPPEVYLSAAHWEDFLENGCIEWHAEDSAGFSFEQLSPALAAALRRFLEQHYGAAARRPPLLNWLRVRHERGDIA